jgi:hypothetical protein
MALNEGDPSAIKFYQFQESLDKLKSDPESKPGEGTARNRRKNFSTVSLTSFWIKSQEQLTHIVSISARFQF